LPLGPTPKLSRLGVPRVRRQVNGRRVVFLNPADLLAKASPYRERQRAGGATRRNYASNIRPVSVDCPEAARQIACFPSAAREGGYYGVAPKNRADDESETAQEQHRRTGV
jgi:hypothetical protein